MKNPVMSVKIDSQGIALNGEYKILLCASLFYFRIPSSQWRKRIEDLIKTGYNTADVYFPWNFHETEKGKFDFSGEKDVGAFLSICAEKGLNVVARFGPYICSEWDSGAIPAWVHYESEKIRTTDPVFLDYTFKWFEQIIPLLAKYQAGKNGSVIMAQLENELDFFDCGDVKNYISALKNKAAECGLTVPLFCCAGQGDIIRAGGTLVNGVLSAYNFYPDIKNPDFDGLCRRYEALSQESGLPLMVTETGRETSLLKREFMAGAKFLGAYNQVAGSNFGYTQAINNWGNPVSVITTKYDFASMIDTLGYFTKEADEARLFSAMLEAYGESAARAKTSETDFEFIANFKLPEKINCLDLYSEGRLICVANLSDSDGTAYLPELGLDVKVKSLRTNILPLNVRFKEGIIEKSNLQVYSLSPLILYGENPQVVLNIKGQSYNVSESGVYDGAEVKIFSEEQIKAYDAGELNCPFRYTDSQKEYAVTDVITGGAFLPTATGKTVSDCSFEANGIWRGGAVYEFETAMKEVLFKTAADFITVYDGGDYKSTVFASGKSYIYKFKNNHITVNAEKWGGSNFDDGREKSLRIKSTKGVENFYDIISCKKLKGWQIAPCGEWLPETLNVKTNKSDAYCDISSYNTTRMPFIALYYMRLAPQALKADKVFIALEGGTAECALYINNQSIGVFHPSDKMLDITDYFSSRGESNIQILVRKRDWAEAAGEAKIYFCRHLTAKISGYGEEFMSGFKLINPARQQFPVRLNAGETKGALIDIPELGATGGCYGVARGKDYKLTAVYGGRVIARMIAPGWPGLVQSGGSAEQFYIPDGYRTDGKLKLFIESIGKETELNFSLLY